MDNCSHPKADAGGKLVDSADRTQRVGLLILFSSSCYIPVACEKDRALPEAGNRTEQGVNPYAWVSVVESVFSLFLPLTSVEARNPAVRVFLFPRRTPRVSNGPEWAAGKKTHGTHSHGVYPSQRSASDCARRGVQWWDKPCIDELLTSVTVGAPQDGVTGRGATTFGEPMAREKTRRSAVQDSVLRAVSRGYRYSGDIAAAAGIKKTEVFAHLRRLMSKGLVECYRCNQGSSRKAYAITSIKVVFLEKLWTKR